jgi:hypothetical protein
MAALRAAADMMHMLALRLQAAQACRHELILALQVPAAAVAHSALHCVESDGAGSNCWVACCIEDTAHRGYSQSSNACMSVDDG